MAQRLLEAQLQRAVAKYLALVLHPSVIWSAIPAGGGGAIRGAQLKQMGLRRGLPDLYIAWEGGTLWIELKSMKGKQTPEQISFSADVRFLGHKYHLARSIDDVIKALTLWAVPFRVDRIGAPR